MGFKFLFAFLFMLSASTSSAAIRVGGKNFTEGYLTGELVAQTIEDFSDEKVERKLGLGGTGILVQALQSKEIDIYVEYTGTLKENILKTKENLSPSELKEKLFSLGFVISDSLGFENTYAIAVARKFAERHNLTTLSDLQQLSKTIRLGLAHEFFSRPDGYPHLTKIYGLSIPRENIRLMEHSLLYTAIENDKVDAIEVYSTDGKIEKLDLVLLKDDRFAFPKYEAVLLVHKDFVSAKPRIWQMLTEKLENSIEAERMISLNAQVDLEKKSFKSTINELLGKDGSIDDGLSVWPRIKKRTIEHLALVGWSLFFCILIGIPMALLALRSPLLSQAVMLLSGLFQTIPSLALLCFLIPVFGIGRTPALVALFLYGLLPIVVNTYVGISSLSTIHSQTARALGLTRWQRLTWIELPLASPHILSGIRTSAVVTIGTATLAALIGAGGYGAPIITGLAINDMNTILIGAVPAAVMAIAAHFLFQVVGAILIPKGLRR